MAPFGDGAKAFFEDGGQAALLVTEGWIVVDGGVVAAGMVFPPVDKRDEFFATVLQHLEQRLAELGSERRVDKDGYEYWDLKPDFKPGEVIEL